MYVLKTGLVIIIICNMQPIKFKIRIIFAFICYNFGSLLLSSLKSWITCILVILFLRRQTHLSSMLNR
jgi:hypothetical protein